MSVGTATLALTKIITETTIFYILAASFALTSILLLVGMKDVVKTKDFEIRRERSNSLESKKRLIFVIRQAINSIITEPMIILGILGAMVDGNIEGLTGP